MTNSKNEKLYLRLHSEASSRNKLLGIDYEQLEKLLEPGKILHQRKQKELEKRKIRLIKAGGGNHSKLSQE